MRISMKFFSNDGKVITCKKSEKHLQKIFLLLGSKTTGTTSTPEISPKHDQNCYMQTLETNFRQF